MELTDALTITALGMAVVFSGLLLTAGLIIVFGRMQRFDDAREDRKAAGAPVEAAAPAEPTETLTGPPLDPDILAVITTVLEVEHRLNRIGGAARRPNPSS
ncbi:MAG: OadG family protein [Thermoanaerobaculales bacterium]|jgi:Na+-transporting methylmalonyl-CoA/oxaloacetate decarboxylase gamma subunit|nr:OadG family protein [Thermoanaerobaculales bacterium]